MVIFRGPEFTGAATKNWVAILVDNLYTRFFQETPPISTGIHSAGAGRPEKPA